jgi:lipoyl-dependent peroxiredoxin
MIRTAKAQWQGTLKEGKGTLTTQSLVLDNTNYGFKARFEEGNPGTNPEELVAAASAGCFTMWVASLLTEKGITNPLLNTSASVTLEGVNITGIHLTIRGTVSGITAEEFTTVTKDAEKNCIISKALSVPITSEAHLVA